MVPIEKQVILISAVVLLALSQAHGDDVIDLNNNNVDSVLNGHDVVLVNFYADWCRFSQILKPVFEEAAKKVKEDPRTATKVAFAKVDCDRENDIAGRFRISKYPTLKLFRHANVVKREYRGQRSADAMFEYAELQSRNPIQEVDHLDALKELDSKKLHIIAYFESKNSDNFQVLYKLANILREECSFHAGFGDVSRGERIGGDRLVFRPTNAENADVQYQGDLKTFDGLFQWAVDKCLPIVREITFENAEELTEEGLPFLILFYNPEEKDVLTTFTAEVSKQLMDEKQNINFLYADGHKFAHPLHHLGKSTQDLPVLAIDSFRHMYLFPHDVKEHVGTPGLLKKFVSDLHSGKLHREFHHGPDPTETPQEPPRIEDQPSDTNNIPRTDGPKPPAPQKITSPPESTFVKLAPSRNRYTILRDEL